MLQGRVENYTGIGSVSTKTEDGGIVGGKETK